MLILGLGSNVGNCLNNLRMAVQLLQKSHVIAPLRISPVYQSSALLPPNAPPTWDRPFLNVALCCETRLSPIDVLAVVKQMEKQVGRTESLDWAPRLIDIDILAWDDLLINDTTLQVPHAELEHRPFALWPLLDLAPEWKHPQRNLSDLLCHWGSRFSGQAPFNTKQIPHRLVGTQVVGILNITPDSFSDGGLFLNVPEALVHAEKLVLGGAEVLDIGAESTRPAAVPLTPEEEWCRLAPVLCALKERMKTWLIKPLVSIDTRHFSVAERAIDLGVDWINDVSGFIDSRMRELLANNPITGVVTHNLGVPVDKHVVLSPHPPICEQILDWAKQRFEQLILAGVDPRQFILDVGIGFGKTAQQSEFLLKNINYFRSLNCPLLIGHSRKSFLNGVTEKPYQERDFETAVLSYQLAVQGVDYVRVHDVELNARAIALAARWLENTFFPDGLV